MSRSLKLRLTFVLLLLTLCLLWFIDSKSRNGVEGSGWILKFITSGDSWRDSPPRSISLTIGPKQRVFEGPEIPVIRDAFARSLISGSEKFVQESSQLRRKSGELRINFQDNVVTYPLEEAVKKPGLFVILVSDRAAPTQTLLYFNDDAFTIRNLLVQDRSSQ